MKHQAGGRGLPILAVLFLALILLAGCSSSRTVTMPGERSSSRQDPTAFPTPRDTPIDRKVTPAAASSEGSQRIYPLPGALPARITYRMETDLLAAPRQARILKVVRPDFTAAWVEDFAGRLGFSQPRAKRVNDNGSPVFPSGGWRLWR